MPKIVDRAAIKEQIATIAWKVLLRDGIRGLSVRTIAAEADLSAGMLRHYFPKQEELLLFSMELVIQRVTLRLQRVNALATPQERLRYAVHQFLPLDAARQLEMEVWLQFVAGSHSIRMSRVRMQTQLQIHTYFKRLIADVWEAEGISSSDEHLAYASSTLHALVDGLNLRYLALSGSQSRQGLIAIADQHLAHLNKGSML